MQLSADSPSGPNVAKQKDIAFMRELEENDPKRLARLYGNVLKISGNKAGWIVGKCSRCHGHILNAPFLVSADEPGEFCSRACRDNEEHTLTRKTRRRTRHFKECKQCGN